MRRLGVAAGLEQATGKHFPASHPAERLTMRAPSSNHSKVRGQQVRGAACALRQTKRSLRPRSRVECWGDAEAALAELGWLQRRLAKIEQRHAQALARVEGAAARVERPLQARQRKLEAALEKFCRSREAAELAGVNGHLRRSRRLLFGRVGYRRSHAVAVHSQAAALRALAHWRVGQKFLRVRTELDREALRRFLLTREKDSTRFAIARQRLGRAGIALEQQESWFYELNWTALEQWG